MIDDGPWAGVPIGGLGTGSIGRTHRGDFARWHLEVGRHAFAPVAADGFSIFVGRPGARRPGDRPVDAPTATPCPTGAGPCPRAPARTTPCSRGPGSRSSPSVLGVRLVGEQLSPVIAGDLEASALPVGVFEWSVENPATEPLTVGIMLTWQDPAADPSRPAPAGAWHETIETPESAGGRPPRPGRIADGSARDVRPGGVPRARRRPSRSGAGSTRSRTRSCGPTSPPTAGSTRPTTGDRASAGEAIGARGRGDRRARARANGASVRFAVAWDLPVVEFGAGRRWWKRYTRDWGRTGERAFDLAAARARADASLARRDRGVAAARPRARADRPDWYKAALFNELYFLVDGGTVLGGRRGRRSRTRARRSRAGSRCSSAPTTRSTTRVDVDFYASFAILRLFPELEARGIRDLLAAVAGRRPGDRHDRGVGPARPAQGRRHRAARRRRSGRRPVLPTEPLPLPGRQRLEGPRARSSSSRSGATRSPPAATRAMP